MVRILNFFTIIIIKIEETIRAIIALLEVVNKVQKILNINNNRYIIFTFFFSNINLIKKYTEPIPDNNPKPLWLKAVILSLNK